MQWHPLIIWWSLRIYFTSPAVKTLGFLKLLHIDTLERHTKFTARGSGFHPDIIKRLAEDASISSLKDYLKNVSLIFDERQIKADLVYHRSTGKLMGFTAMGDINEEFRKFNGNLCLEDDEDLSTTTNYQRDIATHVIVYMVRGLFSKLCYPFTHFASTGFICQSNFIHVPLRQLKFSSLSGF